MKELWNWIKKKDIDIIIVICLIVAKACFYLRMNWSDELWNFANSYKMFEGYKIYRDINVIITPLFFYVAQIFFKIFGATILSFKIYNFFISSSIIIIIYKIFKNLKIVRRRAIAYTLVITILFVSIIMAGANYNLMVIIPILLQMLFIIKNKENDTITGILLFLTFMLKQNVFVYFAIQIFLYKLVTRKNIKETIISLTKIYLTSIMFIALFIVYLYFFLKIFYFCSCFWAL